MRSIIPGHTLLSIFYRLFRDLFVNIQHFIRKDSTIMSLILKITNTIVFLFFLGSNLYTIVDEHHVSTPWGKFWVATGPSERSCLIILIR